MNVLFGLLQPDEGEIWIDGEKKTLPNPAAAIAAPRSGWWADRRSMLASSRPVVRR